MPPSELSVRTSSRRFRATWDEQVSCNPCVACGSARPPTAGPNLDTRPSYQTTTKHPPLRWPPSLPVCGARARLSPRPAHLPLSVASFEEPALSWNRPHATLHHRFREPVRWSMAQTLGTSPLNQCLLRYGSQLGHNTCLPPSSACARAVDVFVRPGMNR